MVWLGVVVNFIWNCKTKGAEDRGQQVRQKVK